MMNGEKFSKKYSRRDILKGGALALLASCFYSCGLWKKKREIPVTFAGSDFKTGHRLRSNIFPEPTSVVQINTLIVGGGVAGLSAARYLKKNNFNDWLLLELDSQVGGNSKSGKNAVSEFPFGAHYLPVPNEQFTDLISFLHEHNIVTGFNAEGLPEYNEYYLCGEPHERIHYKGLWQDGLPPKAGLSNEEVNELNRFSMLMEKYKHELGSDGKPAFTIPLEWSSQDGQYEELDRISMLEFLQRENYKEEFLFWYVNYCCKDDFGTDISRTSAWAGIHYFSARKARTENSPEAEVLTWPEGNNFLVKCLVNELKSFIKNGQLVYRIEPNDKDWNCFAFDVSTEKSTCYKASNVILATPQFVNKHLLVSVKDIRFDDFSYYPWLVANITINNRNELNGLGDLSWDNVFHTSKSLGYVNACHQTGDRLQQKTVITYYYNFSEKEAKVERESLYGKDEAYWKDFIIRDLKTVHPSIEQLIDEIVLYVYGHGMISPSVGFRGQESRRRLSEGFDGLHFINSDVSGISIFEQAFYRGISASKKILKNRGIKS